MWDLSTSGLLLSVLVTQRINRAAASAATVTLFSAFTATPTACSLLFFPSRTRTHSAPASFDVMSSTSSIVLHPLVEHLRSILGTWRGSGEGSFPTLSASFRYSEEVCFEAVHPSKPVIAYSHRTAHADSGAPMHRESGFLKMLPDDKFIWTVAQATGMAEVADGSWDAAKGELLKRIANYNYNDIQSGALCTASTQIAGADKVTNVHREYIFNESSLSYTISMATKQVSQLTVHLTAALVRAAP
jgi:hypothetical protein